MCTENRSVSAFNTLFRVGFDVCTFRFDITDASMDAIAGFWIIAVLFVDINSIFRHRAVCYVHYKRLDFETWSIFIGEFPVHADRRDGPVCKQCAGGY